MSVIAMTRTTEGLRIAPGLTLPLDAVTQTFAILARKGAGKTYLSAVMVEEMVKAGLRVVVLDPLGAYWGLRAGADGKSEGLPVTILGGQHGDIPLEPTAGRVVADLVVAHPGSIVLDLSGFESNAAQDRFVADFAERLYRAKATDPRPLHLMIDEADSFAPQRPMPGQQRMLGAFEAIVRRGRIRGLGVTLITQRPAVLSKSVLTQTECLVTLQMTGPQDRAAIDEWVRGNGTKEQRDRLVDSLAGLQRGQAWFWSPAWLQLFTMVQVRKRETFDSSKTPEAGAVSPEPARLAAVDLESLRKEMAETIERAKADDPSELRKRIVALERELAGGVARQLAKGISGALMDGGLKAPPLDDTAGLLAGLVDLAGRAGEPQVERVEVPAVPSWVLDELDIIAGAHKLFLQQIRDVLDNENGSIIAGVEALASRLHEHVGKPAAGFSHSIERAKPEVLASARTQRAEPSRDRSAPRQSVIEHASRSGSGNVSGPQQTILNALAWLSSVGISHPYRSQVALVAKVSSVSSGFEKNLSVLSREGLIEYPRPGLVSLTSDGAEQAVVPDRPPTTRELQESLIARVSAPQGDILRVLIAVYPKAVTRNELGTRVDKSPSSSGFEKNLSVLRSLGLIDYPQQGTVAAKTVLFLNTERR